MFDAIIDSVRNVVQTTIDGLSTNPDFREGFILAVFWLVVIGLFLFFFRYIWDRFVQFFKPTKQSVNISAGEVQSGFASFLQFFAAAAIVAVLLYGFIQYVL